jgi:hypothetical protein
LSQRLQAFYNLAARSVRFTERSFYLEMTKHIITSVAFLIAASLPWQAKAGTFDFTFAGPGVSGAIALTYGSATDGKYPQALEITGISGTFSDSNNGLNIVNAAIGPLAALNLAAPDPTNLLAPDDFSKFAVASGLPPQANGALTYDNLYYPGGSPPTATDYQVHGGFLDIYGLMFDVDGKVVNFWSNGDVTGTGAIDYGVAVATSASASNYVSGGVSITPEPGTLVLLATGLLAMFLAYRRVSKKSI